MTNNKLTKEELRIIAAKLRGKRQELAEKANVSLGTVNNTFQDLYQNSEVIKAAAEMIKEMLEQKDPNVETLRELIAAK